MAAIEPAASEPTGPALEDRTWDRPGVVEGLTARYGHGPASRTTPGFWRGVDACVWRQPRHELRTATTGAHYLELQLGGVAWLAGRFDGRTGPGRALLSPGSLVFMPAGRPSEWVCEAPVEVLHLYFDRTALRAAAAEFGRGDPDRVELRGALGWRDEAVERVARAFHGELLRPGAAGQLYADTLMQALAVLLLRRCAAGAAPARPPPAGALAGGALRRALEFVEAHLERDIGLAEIAAAAGVSPFHFARAFRRSVGRSPLAHVRGRRVERAKALLSTTRAPVAEVALACGFKGQSHFGQAFRRATGATPGAYRRQGRS